MRTWLPLLAVLVPRPAAATGAAVALSLILVLFTNNLYSPGDARSPLRFSPLIQYQLLARGQSLPAEYAAALGVYLHGLAGDRYREQRGAYSMLAGELAEELGEVMKDAL